MFFLGQYSKTRYSIIYSVIIESHIFMNSKNNINYSIYTCKIDFYHKNIIFDTIINNIIISL